MGCRTRGFYGEEEQEAEQSRRKPLTATAHLCGELALFLKVQIALQQSQKLKNTNVKNPSLITLKNTFFPIPFFC